MSATNSTSTARAALSPDRPLPDFAVIGAMRAGTTTLQKILTGQPGVCLPAMKETDYFIASKNHRRGAGWYESRFDNRHALCGDISPNYAKRDAFPEAPSLIHAANPAARLIYIVRDPVARAISQYNHAWLTGSEMPEPAALLDSEAGAHILNTSRYHWQLQPWLKLFREDQLLIVDFDDLVEQTEPTLACIGTFLDIDLRGSQAAQSNSSAELGRMPGWWMGIRESALGAQLRALLPGGLAGRIKSLAAVSGPAEGRTPPAFPAPVIDALRAVLAADAAALRRDTGMAFENWSV
ncbi:sulfotransferase family protein [Aquisalinus flavus]|uniref:Sulfotransferase n=1 Tax=Aquisalinus flavus TaxID=1526572 RepID=A0A8J2V4Y3_9PROT|nr:sulfotransferase [Aquisalinus flavus]MBD0427582.1 sulfotransferase [Aquisalinus flavus]UNE47374.1 sulfotransferase domain-containing protein [Aquisalinus flavus]GGD02138.1 sulfotransferase [Aquisalinus flavus]